jgi:hypothetical protein
MILNILKNSKITKLIFNLLISFLFLSLFLFVKAQQTSDYKECSPSGQPDCIGLSMPVPVCYNGWVPGKKQIVDLLALIVFMITNLDTEDHGVSILGQQSVLDLLNQNHVHDRLIAI